MSIVDERNREHCTSSTFIAFMKPNDLALTSEGVCVAKKIVSNVGSSRREKATFRQGVIANPCSKS